jgi:uncharacterized membrane protein
MVHALAAPAEANMEHDAQSPDRSPSLTNTIERYIRTIIHLRMRAASERTGEERAADSITAFSGRMLFVYLNLAFFVAWFLLNAGLPGLRPFDPYPYGLLTMIVSLEAIFLATFVLISQNRMTDQAEHRADLDLHIDLLTEYELTRVLQMLDAIHHKLGIEDSQGAELVELERETDPEEVLAEIERLQQMARNARKPPATHVSASA